MKRVNVTAAAFCLLMIFIFTTTSADWNKISLVDNHSFQNWLPDRSVRWNPSLKCYVIVYGGDRLYLAFGEKYSWRIEVIDYTIGRGRSNSMFIEPDGKIHISYYDALEKNVRYAFLDNFEWHNEPAQENWDAGYYNSIAVDSNSNVYIAYYAESPAGDNFIIVSEKKNDVWTEYPVDTTEGCGLFPSIAIAGDGYPSVSYYCELGGGNTALKYSHFNGTGFTPQTVDTDGGLGNSLAFSDSGTPHIAYYKNADPYHAWWTGVSWDTEVVDDSVYVVGLKNQLEFVDGVLTLLTLDSTNYKLMLYRKDPVWASEEVATGSGDGMAFAGAWNDDQELNVALKEGYFDGARMSAIHRNSLDEWSKVNLDEYIELGNARELAVDSDGWPHAVYAKDEGYYIGWNDNQWERQALVADIADPYYFSGIDTLPDGMPTVLFISDTNELIWRRKFNSMWDRETIPVPTDAAFAAKVRTNQYYHYQYSQPHILYLDSGSDLYYATCDTFYNWEHQLLSSGFIVGKVFDLEVDSMSNAHVVFRNENDNLMTYRMIDPAGGWSSANFASSGTIGESCNLALDQDESPIILYTEAGSDGLWLKYDDGSKGWADNLLTTGIKQYALNGLDVDKEGGVHLSYFDNENNELHYGYLESPDDPTMETVLIETFVSNLPSNSSLVLDPWDYPMILYNDPNYGKLNLACDKPQPQINSIYPNTAEIGSIVSNVKIDGIDFYGVTQACLVTGSSYFQDHDCQYYLAKNSAILCDPRSNPDLNTVNCTFDFSYTWPEQEFALVIDAANGTVTLEDAFSIYDPDNGDDDCWDDDYGDDDQPDEDDYYDDDDDDNEKDCCGCEGS